MRPAHLPAQHSVPMLGCLAIAGWVQTQGFGFASGRVTAISHFRSRPTAFNRSRVLAVIVPFDSHERAGIDRLVKLVSADMERVNDTILSRTGSDVTMIPEVANHLISS